MMRISRREHTPIFIQIADELRQHIERGTFKVGDVLPSEREYAEQLQVSRMTVRAALDKLVNEGLLVRQHGRGTIVAAAKINRNALGFMSFTEDMQSRGMEASSQILTFRAQGSDAATAAQLGLPVGAKTIFLERVRLADGEALALERVHLPHDRFSDLLKMNLAQHSLYTLLELHFGCYPTVADETVEATSLSVGDARVLGVPRHSPALLACRITRDDHGTPIESVQTLYRADRYRMVFTRTR
jgi:GntR family transcriptional regulator